MGKINEFQKWPLVSQEELQLRWDYGKGKIKMTLKQFRKKVQEIRKRTGKPLW